jgi:hypothetical protein
MPINRLLKNSSFGPDASVILLAAYHEVIAAIVNPLKLKVPAPLAEAVARKIIAIGQRGERDRAALVQQVFEEIGVQKPRSRATKVFAAE